MFSRSRSEYLFFFFNGTAPTEIYTLSLHDALPIYGLASGLYPGPVPIDLVSGRARSRDRSEEHTSELQSRSDLVCRLLLEKKKNNHMTTHHVSRHQQRT